MLTFFKSFVKKMSVWQLGRLHVFYDQLIHFFNFLSLFNK